jgi:hypothetical protein
MQRDGSMHVPSSERERGTRQPAARARHVSDECDRAQRHVEHREKDER